MGGSGGNEQVNDNSRRTGEGSDDEGRGESDDGDEVKVATMKKNKETIVR